MNNWISVKERLPENWNIVLACGINGDRYLTEFKFGNFYRYTDQVGKDRLIIFYYNNITHWMPLPEPPKPTK